MKVVNFNLLSTEEVDWLIGFYLADGSKWKDPKKRTYRVWFYISPKEFSVLKKLKSVINKLNLKCDIKNVKKLGTIFVRVTSKEFFDKMPDKKLNSKYSPKNMDAFIAGFLDGDGFILVKRSLIGFSQSVVKWIGPLISNYFRGIGINPWVEKLYRNAFYYRTSLKKVKEKTTILKFMAKAEKLPDAKIAR